MLSLLPNDLLFPNDLLYILVIISYVIARLHTLDFDASGKENSWRLSADIRKNG